MCICVYILYVLQTYIHTQIYTHACGYPQSPEDSAKAGVTGCELPIWVLGNISGSFGRIASTPNY